MKRWAMLTLFVATMLFQAGCGGAGVALSHRERMHRMQEVMENDWRQYADDVDLFWLNDRYSRLSKWSIR